MSRRGLNPKERELFERPNFAHLATVNADGSPQVSPVWVDLVGDRIRVNTAVGRVKDRNVRRDPRVALSLHDQGDPYTRVSVQGRVVEITEEGADAHIDELSQKYDGVTPYPGRTPGMRRLILLIEPERVTSRL